MQKKTRTRLGSILLTMAMLLSLLPVTAGAIGNEGVGDPGTDIYVMGEKDKYATIAAALGAGETSIKLIANLTENVAIPSGKPVSLNLNGYKLTNDTTNTTADTIYVALGGQLTITGSGTVDNVSHAKAAIFNNGTVILNGGNYTRSEENGQNKNESGDNSYYNIVNHGVMTINSGVSVTQNGHFSSLVENGYYNYASNDSRFGYVDGTNSQAPEMTIHGGTFSGGINTIKNDDGAELTINNGDFSNYTQAVVQNHNITTINGGTFTAGTVTEGETYGVDNCGCAADIDVGTLTITGGTFIGATYGVYDRSSLNTTVVTITGGDINGTEKALKKSRSTTFDVAGGTFSSNVTSSYLRDGYICTKNESDSKYTVTALDATNAGAQVTDAEGQTTYFKSLSAALGAVEDGGTVKLLKNADIGYGPATISGTNITLDLGGYKASCAYQAALKVAANSSVTIKNGTLFSSNTNSTPTLLVKPNVALTIAEDATIVGPYAFGLADTKTATGGSGVRVNIYGTVRGIDSTDDTNLLSSGGTIGIGINGQITSTTDCATIHIYDGAVVSGTNGSSGNANHDDGPAIYAAGYANWIIDEGATLSGGEALSIKSGKFTINGGTFTANGTFVDPATSYSNGTEATGAAISITTNHDYAKNVEMTISGGTFTSEKGYAIYESDTQTHNGSALGSNGIQISGGNFTGIEGAVYTKHAGKCISGGTFSSNPNNYLATGYTAKENAPSEGKWTVEAKPNGGMAVTDTKAEGNTVSTTLEGVYTGTGTAVDNATSSSGSTTASGNNDEGNLTVDLTQTDGGSITTATLEIKNNTAASLDAANSLTLKGNVGTVKLDAQALDAIAKADGDVTIEIKKNGDTYTVTAKAGTDDLLPADSGTNATVTISVPYTLDSSKTDVLVFWVDGTQPEPMKTTYSAGESGNAGTLTWTTPHLSEFMGVSYADTDEVVYFTSNTTGTAGSLAAALEAVKSNGGTIYLLKNATLDNANYTISKAVELKDAGVSSSTPIITAKVATGETTQAFAVKDGGKLTLDGVTMTINGTKNSDDNKGNDGTGIDVNFGGTLELVNGANLTLKNLERGTISSKSTGSTPGVFKISGNSILTAENIDGNFSNGGAWELTNDSKIEISGCTSHGMSCDSLTVDNSTVNVSGTGLLGVTAREIKLENHGQITVDNCGTDLPKESQWSTDGESYKYPVEIKKNGSVSVDSTSSVKLLNNKSGNTIYLVESNLENSGTINAQVVTKAPAGSYTVTVMDRGTVLVQKPVSSSSSYTLPAAPAAPSGYTFAYWLDGDGKTYAANAKVSNITTNMTFTAQWQLIPTTTPTPDTPSYDSGSSAPDGDYIVSVDKVSGGKVTVSPGRADKGDEVTVTVKPSEGYELDELVVTDSKGNEVRVYAESSTKFTFTMPSGTVDIKATFVKTDAGSVLDDFVDLNPNAWYAEAVEFVIEEGLMTGTSAAAFAPDASMSRAMIWTVLAAYNGYNTSGGNPWYAPGQQWAMINGVSDGTSPDGSITREQLAVMLWRAAGSPETDKSLSGYADASSVSDWAETAMAWAVDNGIITGMGGNSLAPQSTATRAQVAVMLMQFVNYMED